MTRGSARTAATLVLMSMTIGLALTSSACEDNSPPSGGAAAGTGSGSTTTPPTTRAMARLDTAVTPAAPIVELPGLAAVVLIDVSGSMERTVRGGSAPKIDIAKRAALSLVEQFVRYAADHPKETVLLRIAEFSARRGEPDVREVVSMGAPDLARARLAIEAMAPEGGTPIGSAIVDAKRALDATGLARRHLLVVTDGENTDGDAPEDVVAAIGRRPDLERPSIYFVAFDIEASRFDDVRKAGGLVFQAASGKALGETIDSLLRGKILIEK